MSRLQGFLYNDAGEPIQGATVTALEAGTTTTIGSTDSTDANGSWQFTSGLTGKNIDVKIQSGSSIRFLKHADHVQVEHMWVRSDTAAGTPPARIENSTNNASNAVLELVGDNSTRADGDEIYISFKLDDDGGNETEFARITAEANDVSNGSEDGELRYSVMSGGSLTEVFVMSSAIGGGTAFDITTSTVSMATDSFTIKSEDDGSAAVLKLQADQGDDNADKWQFSVADGGTLTINSEISGSAVAHMTLTPNSTVTSSTVAFAGLVTTAGNLTVGGDLTITGDDLVMGTNTAGMLLIADGTNFNPTSITSLSAISSIGAADTLLAIDDTDGALKKVTRSTLVSGLASGTMTEVQDDSSPQLGGDLDVNGNDIVSTSNANISLLPNGSGKVIADGNGSSGGVSLSDGVIDIRTGTGSQAKVLFYCESSNAHAQTLQAQPHSAGVTNTLTLPAGGSSTLVSLESTDTLTNKTLTSPKINEDVALTSTATELNLLDGVSGLVQADFTKLAAVDATATELNIMDGNTTVGTDAIADDDGIVTNDGGTMKQTKVQTLATYMEGEIDNLTAMDTTVYTGAGALSNDTHKGVVIEFLAGESLAIGDWVYMSTVDGRVSKADANDTGDDGHYPAIGVAVSAQGSAGSAVQILTHGVYNDSDGFGGSDLTEGKQLFLSETAGTVTATAPSDDGDIVQVCGIAVGPRDVLVNPSLDIIEHA